jgi:hypothetical protein
LTASLLAVMVEARGKGGEVMTRVMILLVVAALMMIVLSVSAPVAFAKQAPNKPFCKDGGWQHIIDPDTGLDFTDQGQCVSNYNHLFDSE